MISAEEEVELTYLIRNGDVRAMQKLVEANLRFVISVAKQYVNQGLSFADLINEGNVGLVKAAGRFDETRGFKFISYAVWWIRQSIIQAISEQTRVVRLPQNRILSIKKIAKAMPYLEQMLEREPTNHEMAEYLDIAEELVEVNNVIKHRHLSFDKPLMTDGESDSTLYDLVRSGEYSEPDGEMMNESVKTDLSRGMQKLEKREAEIITLAFGLNGQDELNLHEIASQMNLSSERVRQIRNSGLSKLHRILKGKSSFNTNY